MPLFHGKMWLIVGAITHIRLARARVYWLWAAHCRVAQLNRRHSVAPYEYQNPITGEYVSSLAGGFCPVVPGHEEYSVALGSGLRVDQRSIPECLVRDYSNYIEQTIHYV